jgi:hypothetical protein
MNQHALAESLLFFGTTPSLSLTLDPSGGKGRALGRSYISVLALTLGERSGSGGALYRLKVASLGVCKLSIHVCSDISE